MKKKILIFIALFLIPAAASAQLFKLFEKSVAPMIADRLYIWPASDCVLRHVDFPPADGDDTLVRTGRVDRFPHLTVRGNTNDPINTDEVFGKGTSFICPVRLPKDSKISKIGFKGIYMGAETPLQTWVQLDFVEKQDGYPPRTILSKSQRIDPGELEEWPIAAPIFYMQILDGEIPSDWVVKGPGVPTYFLIRVYQKSGSFEDSLSNQAIDLVLMFVEYSYTPRR